MWKYIRIPLLCAVCFVLGASYTQRKKPLVIYKDCTAWLEQQGVVRQ